MVSARNSSRSGRGREQRPVSGGVLEVSWQGSVATVFLDGVESSSIDVDRPHELEFEYMQHMDVACRVFLGANGPLRALHVGGAAAALPWAWSVTRPQSRHTVVEIDPLVIEVVREWFDLPRAPQMKMRCQDGREALDGARQGAWDVVVRDAFAGGEVPAHLATVEAARAAALALRPGGVYLVNAAHGGGADARCELEALHGAFGVVCAVLDPKVGRGGRRGNVVFVCSSPAGEYSPADVQGLVAECDRELRRLPLPARIMWGEELRRWQAGRRSLSDAAIGYEAARVPHASGVPSGDGASKAPGAD